jgi:pilus assembly protein Flp/PilA
MLIHKEKGQGMVEYVLILVLVTVVGLVVWGLLGDAIINTLETIMVAFTG